MRQKELESWKLKDEQLNTSKEKTLALPGKFGIFLALYTKNKKLKNSSQKEFRYINQFFGKDLF